MLKHNENRFNDGGGAGAASSAHPERRAANHERNMRTISHWGETMAEVYQTAYTAAMASLVVGDVVKDAERRHESAHCIALQVSNHFGLTGVQVRTAKHRMGRLGE